MLKQESNSAFTGNCQTVAMNALDIFGLAIYLPPGKHGDKKSQRESWQTETAN
jgi:hypothetical protein